MEHLDHLSDEQLPIPEELDSIDPIDLERAESEGAEMAAKGLIKVTSNGRHLSLMKGKPSNPDDNSSIVDLT